MSMGTHLRLHIRTSYPLSPPTSYTFVQSMKVFVIKKCIFKLKSLDLSLNPRKIFKYFLIGFKLKSSGLSLNLYFMVTKSFILCPKTEFLGSEERYLVRISKFKRAHIDQLYPFSSSLCLQTTYTYGL